MTLPNFLVIGAQKSGSTWLNFNLSEHPDVYMYPHEIHFFDQKMNFDKGINWYLKHFSQASKFKAIGETTPAYLWVEHALKDHPKHLTNIHQNIYQLFPDIKLILILRNPVHRAISAVNHYIKKGNLSPFLDIDNFLLNENGNKYLSDLRYNVINRGHYATQIKAYRKYFDAKQMLILIFEEDILQTPEKGLEKVCDFLGIGTNFKFKNYNRKLNENTKSRLSVMLKYYFSLRNPFVIKGIDRFFPRPKAKLNPSQFVIEKLYTHFEGENQKLFDLLGRRINAWQHDQY